MRSKIATFLSTTFSTYSALSVVFTTLLTSKYKCD